VTAENAVIDWQLGAIRARNHMRTQTPNKVVAYVVLAAATLFFILPFAYHKISGAIDNKYQEPVTIEWAQATFVNLDGRVQIKKVNSARWVEADYRTTIEKGDTVRTGSHGTARIISADGAFYTAKPNTVITLLGVANGSSNDSSR
jgi:hypothetical protein